MAHNLDTTDGQTSFLSAREDAWHRLGRTLDHSFTAEEAMTEGLLGGWNVRKLEVPTVFDESTGSFVEMTNVHPVVRTNPVNGKADFLGRVGPGYQIIQNEEHAGLLNALVDESGAHFETAGALDGGRKVFITMKLPGHISIGGVDPIENYIAAINSHDGSSAFTLMVTPVRVVCANTLNVAFQNKSHSFRIRHTSGAEKQLHSQARQALDMTFNYLDGFQEQAEQLINTAMSQAKFEELIEREFGAPEGAAAATVTRATRKIEELSELFSDSFTHEGMRETAWAGFNALTEWEDHFAPTRGDAKDEKRAEKALLYPSLKTKALDLVLSV